MNEELRDWISDLNPEARLADGFEAAILGVAERCSQEPVVVYDAEKCIEILIERDGCDRDTAVEHFEFNVLGAWVGDGTPLFLWRRPR